MGKNLKAIKSDSYMAFFNEPIAINGKENMLIRQTMELLLQNLN